jgi:hypothetical protein
MTSNSITTSTRTLSRRSIPLLVLHPFLDPALQEVLLRSLLDEDANRAHHLSCAGLNDTVPIEVIVQWIHKLASDRLELKVRRFEERLKQLSDERRAIIREPYPRYYGNLEEIPPPRKEYTRRDFSVRSLWEQLLYEALMEAMGYSKNRSPFLTLAQAMRLDMLRQHSLADTHTMMALLFGAAGLLPSPRTLADKASRAYVRSLRRRWKEVKGEFKGKRLNEGDWLFFRLRPHNFPTARLASVCFILPSLFANDGFQRLIGSFSGDISSPSRRIESLAALFVFTPDDFWRHHVHFREPAGRSGVALGNARVNEILVNVIIPMALLYARVFNNAAIRTNAHKALSSLRASPDNLITRTIQRDLLGTRAALETAGLQQGAIQLYKFFCLPGRCQECAIGKQIPHTCSSGK